MSYLLHVPDLATVLATRHVAGARAAALAIVEPLIDELSEIIEIANREALAARGSRMFEAEEAYLHVVKLIDKIDEAMGWANFERAQEFDEDCAAGVL
jgi:hypothetical protein